MRPQLSIASVLDQKEAILRYVGFALDIVIVGILVGR